MKLFVVALIAIVACAQAFSPEQKTALVNLKKACVAASKVDEADIAKLRAKEDISNEALKNYVGCMFSKLGFIDESGALQEDKMKAKLPEDFDINEATKFIAACKNSKGADVNETAFLAYKCFLSKSSILFDF